MEISVLIVIHNEQDRLPDCLESVKNFSDVLVVDIGSTDSSTKIASTMGFQVIKHEWVPIVEWVLPSILPSMKFNWIIRVDPDEVLPQQLIDDLNKLEPSDKTGIINLPYQYYFLNEKLSTTIWGKILHIPRVLNRKRVDISRDVHRGLKCKTGFGSYDLPFTGNNAVKHYWVDSFQQLFEKHKRYIEMEGESRYSNNQRFSWKTLVVETLASFYLSFFKYSGWRGGWPGWFLSFFYTWYSFKSWLSLKKFERSLEG